MTQQDIVDAFNARLATFPNLPQVAWEGIAFEPRVGHAYFSAQLSSYVRQGVGAGRLGAVDFFGSFTITIRRPADEGRQPAGQQAAQMVTFFGRDVALATAAGEPIIIMDVTEQPATYFGPWVSIPVTINFAATT